MIKVLLVEDETDFGETAKDILELGIGGYQVTLATNGEDGLEKFKQFSPDVIVTDVDMPYMDGLKMVDYIRKEDTNIPILFVSGLQTANDVIKGYEVGANNYIKKPFEIEELDAHIKSIIRLKAKNKDCIDIGCYTFYPIHGKIFNHKNGEINSVTSYEAKVLELLLNNLNEITTKENIFSLSWLADAKDINDNSIYTHISNIRQYFKDDSNISIKSFRGIGYMLRYTGPIL